MGIVVSSAVMSFEDEGLAFNLLDTRHQDLVSTIIARWPGPQRGHGAGH
jgi:hypothetical protein